MTKTLFPGILLTAVTVMPLAARADWDDLGRRKANLEQKGTNLEGRGEELETKGKALEAEGRADEVKARAAEDEGRVVEKKSVTTYRNGHKYVKTTTAKLHREE